MTKGKKLITLFASVILTASTSMTAFAGNWETVGNDWKYKEDNGTYAVNGWQWIDGKSYYFDANGIMAKDTTIDGYTVNADGQWTVNGVVQTQGTTGQTASADGVNHSDGYDPAHPLKNVMDDWNLRLTPETNFLNYSYICSNDNVHAMLTGQMEYYHERTGNMAYLNETEQALYQWFCNWLNGMDFEHMSEMERAKEIKNVLSTKSYRYEAGKKDMYYSILIDGIGYCSEFTMTANSLAKALGLRATVDMVNTSHAYYYIQVDGIAYMGSNMKLDLDMPSAYQPSAWTN